MTIEKMLTQQVLEAVKACYGVELTEKDVQLQETRKEFAGDLTVVVFPFTRYSRKSPEETAKELGEYLKQNIEEVETYNVIKGFLNVVISSAYWIEVLNILHRTRINRCIWDISGIIFWDGRFPRFRRQTGIT